MKSHGGKRELTVEDELTEEEKRNLFGHLHVPSASDMSMYYRFCKFYYGVKFPTNNKSR